MTPVGARSRAPAGVVPFSPSGQRFPKGLSPFGRRGILPLCFLTFTQLSLVADDCKKLLVESMNAFLEPIRDRRKALDKRPQARLGHARSRQRQSPRPGLAESGCAQEKAELYLLEGRKMPPAAGGLSPRTPDLENNDACWRAKPRANRRRYFPQEGFPKGLSPFGRRKAFFLFAS